MKKNNNSKSVNWLRDNFWNLFITFVSIIVAFVSLQGRVTANEKDIKTIQIRMDKIEVLLENLPTKEYLDLKIDPIQKDLLEVKLDVKKLQGIS